MGPIPTVQAATPAASSTATALARASSPIPMVNPDALMSRVQERTRHGSASSNIARLLRRRGDWQREQPGGRRAIWRRCRASRPQGAAAIAPVDVHGQHLVDPLTEETYVNQIAVLTHDDRLVEMLRTLGPPGHRGRSRQTCAATPAPPRRPQVLVVDVRGQRPAPAGARRLPPSAPERGRRARRVLARPAADARGDAGRRQRVRRRTAHAQGARRGGSSRADECRTASRRPGVRVRRRQGRRRDDHAGRQHRGGARPRAARQRAAHRPAHRRTATRRCSSASSRASRCVDALENIHRVDESFFSGLVEKTDVGRAPARFVHSRDARRRSTTSEGARAARARRRRRTA